MAGARIHTIDLKFQGFHHAIASYMILHRDGAILIETGPGSTLGALESELSVHGLTLRDITHVFLTHIHLDHGGAAGRLAQFGARIHVHPAVAPHLLNPEKLIGSATRIYGENMGKLWGEFLPVAESHLGVVQHEEQFEIGEIKLIALHTPGHAEHHVSYLLDDMCFTGDVGGVRIPGYPYLRVPMPPPELHFEKWYQTLGLLRKTGMKYIVPTHFGVFDDPQWHLDQVEASLKSTEKWLETIMPDDPPIEVLREKFINWVESDSSHLSMDETVKKDYDLANPLGMSADGLQRYWRKYRSSNQ